MVFSEAKIDKERERLQRLVEKDEEARIAYELFEEEYRFRQALTEARQKAGLTQKDVAERSGLSQQAVSRIERYDGGGTLRSILRYTKAIGHSLSIK